MAYDLKALAKKRFLNVPVLYWAAAAVLVLAIVAWRMKPITPDEAEAVGEAGAGGDESGGLNDPTTADYDSLLPSGTVVVQPQAPAQADPVEQTNEKWAQAAQAFLITPEGGNVPPGEAQVAIQLYMQGGELSTVQAGYRDRAIKKLGFPPENLGTIGTVTPTPEAGPQKQFNVFPGKHSVKGASDNTAAKLAVLYYGSGSAGNGANQIVQYNTGLGPVGTTYNVGATINIPKLKSPVYFTATATTRYAKQIADKYKPNRTPEMITALNPTLSWPVAVGTKVRVE